MGISRIEWTDVTWNPVRGCSRISPGCKNCYAERHAIRMAGHQQPYAGLVRGTYDGPRWTGLVRFSSFDLGAPLHWRKRRRVFVNSMSDLFHESLTNEQIAAVFGVMAACPQHVFQVLTKRAGRMREWFALLEALRKARDRFSCVELVEEEAIEHIPSLPATATRRCWPLENVWLGVSVEDQQRAYDRIPELVATPARVRFVSYEPALGPVDLSRWLPPRPAESMSIDWVIAGAESGPHARPMDEGWIRAVRDQCAAANVPFFYKQRLEQGRKVSLPELDGHRHAALPR